MKARYSKTEKVKGFHSLYMPKNKKVRCIDWLKEQDFYINEEVEDADCTFEEVNKVMHRLENGKVEISNNDLYKLGLYFADTFLLDTIIDATKQLLKK